VAKQFAFDQVVRKGGAINPDQRTFGNFTVGMYSLSYPFFSNPRITLDEDRIVGLGKFADDLANLPDSLAFADYCAKCLFARQSRFPGSLKQPAAFFRKPEPTLK
jgi:hypothetical protein